MPFLLGGIVAGLLAQLDESDGVLQLAIELGERAEPLLEIGALAHQLLRGVGIVPELRILDLGVQLGETSRRSIDVKDASSAVPWTA